MSKLSDKLKSKIYSETFFEQTLTVYSDREVIIENVKRLLESNEICVRLSTSLGEVSVWGKDLIVTNCKGSIIHINGYITSVEISRRWHNV